MVKIKRSWLIIVLIFALLVGYGFSVYRELKTPEVYATYDLVVERYVSYLSWPEEEIKSGPFTFEFRGPEFIPYRDSRSVPVPLIFRVFTCQEPDDPQPVNYTIDIWYTVYNGTSVPSFMTLSDVVPVGNISGEDVFMFFINYTLDDKGEAFQLGIAPKGGQVSFSRGDGTVWSLKDIGAFVDTDGFSGSSTCYLPESELPPLRYLGRITVVATDHRLPETVVAVLSVNGSRIVKGGRIGFLAVMRMGLRKRHLGISRWHGVPYLTTVDTRKTLTLCSYLGDDYPEPDGYIFAIPVSSYDISVDRSTSTNLFNRG
ncbi:hypothetical protein [Thermococcus gammatolerans]|uniref:Uncharacterized protein n=1 Tax=Thermococcus gammatolerans (strain DSM 15229 / JCM 11827 / EJ3) TaxID=593117 RepID=C5A3G0_THEGJ|nr:hypothetical protein [Thermococcus gammatolerans]ACS32772.1 Hypothetical protein TGAM_0270 [Thermococcus gammatolerans EJ3]